MAQIKIQVLAVGAQEDGKNNNGGIWYRRSLQVFTGEVAGNHIQYGTPEELDQLTSGEAMAEVNARAGNYGRIEFVISKVSPIKVAQKASV